MKFVSRYSLLMLFLLIELLLTACGFQLRGSEALNFSLVTIQSESANRVASEIQRLLIERGVQVVSNPQTAQVIVHLRNETVDKRVLTVSAVSGKLAEVELNFGVEFEARQPDGTVLLKPQRIRLLRDYSFDETAVLAMGAEEETLHEEMFREIVAQLMRRLQAIP